MPILHWLHPTWPRHQKNIASRPKEAAIEAGFSVPGRDVGIAGADGCSTGFGAGSANRCACSRQ
jgi:hypothetical protein